MAERVVLEVHVNLDSVPGAFHTKEDAGAQVQRILDRSIAHYIPRVFVPTSK